MSETVSHPCILCGSNEKKVILPRTLPKGEKTRASRDYACTSTRHREHWQIVQCRNCSFVFADPRESNEEIARGYKDSEDKLYLAEEKGRIVTFERVCRGIMDFKSGGRILDIGCSIGTFLEVCKKHGFDVYGSDLSRWSVQYAKEKKNLQNVFYGNPESQKLFPTNSFDVITMLDLIEHLVDPIHELEIARNFLKHDGVLAIGTMNVNSWPVKLLRGHWPWYMKMHIYYFSPETIEKLLQKTGFKVIKIVKKYSHCISLRYTNHKLKTYMPLTGKVVSPLLKTLRLEDLVVPIDLGDFMTVYATKA